MSASGGVAGKSRPLRVAYVLHRFPSLTETFIAREMHWIRAHGIEVSIYSLMRPKHAAPSPDGAALESVATHSRWMSRRVLSAQIRFLRRSPAAYLRALGGIVRQTFREPRVMALALALFPKSVYFAALVEDRGIEHVHANFVWLEGLTAGVIRDLTGVGFTLQPHAFGLFGRNQADVRAELANATHIVTISEYHRSYITRLCPAVGPESISIVHCGVETDRLTPGTPAPAGAPPRILSVGRAIEKKGHDVLVDACGLLAARGIPFRCDIVVGEDTGRHSLQDHIDRQGLKDRVRLLGAHDQAALLEQYRTSEVFALACVVAGDGDRDGIPVVLMEAMACELPVVTTAVAGIPELVAHEDSGLIVPQRDAVALADALQRLLADPGLRARLGREGRRVVQASFEAERNAALMAEVFRRVAASNPGPRTGMTAGA